jgi:hypothetical protein
MYLPMLTRETARKKRIPNIEHRIINVERKNLYNSKFLVRYWTFNFIGT